MKLKNPSPLRFAYANNRPDHKLPKDYGECVVNAIVNLTGLDYIQVRKDLLEVNAKWTKRSRVGEKCWRGKKTFRQGVDTDTKEFEEYARSIGLRCVYHYKGTIKMGMSDAHKKYGDCIMSIQTAPSIDDNPSYHMVCIKGGRYYDYHDSRIMAWMEKFKAKEKNKMKWFKNMGCQITKIDKDAWRVTGITEAPVLDVWVKI